MRILPLRTNATGSGAYGVFVILVSYIFIHWIRTYLVHDDKHNEDVVAKVQELNRYTTDELDYLTKAFESLGRDDCRNIVVVNTYYNSGNYGCFIMEYCNYKACSNTIFF